MVEFSVAVDSHQVYWDDGDAAYSKPTQVAGFVAIRGASFSIITGVAEGEVTLRITIADAATLERAARDDELVEFSIPRGNSNAFDIFGASGISESPRRRSDCQSITKPTGAVLRVRVVGLNRSANWDQVVPVAAESYDINIWGESAPRPPIGQHAPNLPQPPTGPTPPDPTIVERMLRASAANDGARRAPRQ